MTDQEVADFLSKERGREVTLVEAQEVHRDLRVMADLMIDMYFDFKKRGLLDEKGV